MNPLVSIVIPVYNGANYLACAIESALSQTYAYCETIVVNDGSTDGGDTERIALSFGDRIRYFSKENGGVASALNVGIKQMRGEYFCWLSHDDYYLPDKVLHELQTIPEQYPDTLIFSDYIYYDTITGHRLAVVMEKGYTQRQLAVPLFPVMFQLIHGCATMIHRSHFDRVGLFDEAQPSTQDYDMWFRAFRNTRTKHCAFCDMVSRIHPQAGNQTIPEFIDDACAFLIRSDKMLIDAERAEISGTPHRYYQQMYQYIANTKYRAAKRYFAAAATQDKYSYHCKGKDEKQSLLQTLERNCKTLPGDRIATQNIVYSDEAALDAMIRQRLEQYNRMHAKDYNERVHRPKWRLDTRIVRALLRYGLYGTIKKGWDKLFQRD